ncbi:MAG: hypothetical protein ACR2OU_21830 [Thermomicrobiales bacterium]
MEPRPQRPRPTSAQGPSQQPHADGPSSTAPQQGYSEGADPTGFIAPPRTEYDYSPLDLAPPGQRRRRQLVAGVIGIFALLLIGAIGVFGYLLLRDDSPDTRPNVAATQTALAQQEASLEARQTEVANLAPKATGTPGENAGTAAGTNEQVDAGAAATKESTKPAPTATTSAASAGPTVDQLKALLPDKSIMPIGIDTVAEKSLDEPAVVAALASNPGAQENLDKWGWSGNVGADYSASDPASLDPSATTVITVSLHGFGSDAFAADAVTFYSDALTKVDGSWQEASTPALGGKARLLTQTLEDGTTNVALYVQKGNVLYRIGGSSPGGDPTQSVLQVATQMLGG